MPDLLRDMRLTRTPRILQAKPRVSVLGIDPSLTSTGFSYRSGLALVTGHVDTGELRGPWRLSYIHDRIEEVLDKSQPTLVVYEDYAYGKGGGKKQSFGRVFDLGEVGGVLKRLVWQRGIDMLIVPGSVNKKIIAGKGKLAAGPAGKREMVAALRKFGCHVPQYDEADACALMLVGEIRTGIPTIPENVRQSLRLDSLSSCELIPGKLQSIAKRG